MKVSQLIEILSKMDPNARVFEERTGEYRELKEGDVRTRTWEDEEDADGNEVSGPVVILASWD